MRTALKPVCIESKRRMAPCVIVPVLDLRPCDSYLSALPRPNYYSVIIVKILQPVTVPRFTSCPQSPQALPVTAKRAPRLATSRAGPRSARCLWSPVDRWDRTEGSPKLAHAGRVTGKSLARGMHRCEAARVTSERKRCSDAGGTVNNRGDFRRIFQVTRK